MSKYPKLDELLRRVPNPGNRVFVTGFPRSGTHWLFWTLADVLQCPAVGGYEFENRYTERVSDYRILHNHLMSMSGGFSMVEASSVKTRATFLMVRDPRDVYASILNYYEGKRTVEYLDRWSEYNQRWIDSATAFVRYEDMKADTVDQIGKALFLGGFSDVKRQVIIDAVNKNSFEAMKKAYDKNKSWKPKNMYNRGVVGNWQGKITNSDLQHIQSKHGTLMERLGYDLV